MIICSIQIALIGLTISHLIGLVLCHVLSNTSDTEQIASELSCLYRSGTVLFLAFKEVYIDKADRLIALLPLHSEKLEKRQRPLNHQNHIIEYKVIFC